MFKKNLETFLSKKKKSGLLIEITLGNLYKYVILGKYLSFMIMSYFFTWTRL